MRSCLLLLAATALSCAAHAASLVSVGITGSDVNNNSFAIDFSLNPGAYTGTAATGFGFSDPNGSINGTPDALTISIDPAGPEGDFVEVQDAGNIDEFFNIYSNFTSITTYTDFVAGTTAPVIDLGTYSGTDLTTCGTASLKWEFPGAGLPPTLAMFQMPTLTVNCSAPVSLVASTITPEPSSIALFATGALGVAGIVRRRFHA